VTGLYITGKREKRWTVALFLTPSLIGLLVFCLIPMIASIVYSLLDYDLLKPIESIEFVGLRNFIKVLTGRELYETGLHTLTYVVLYVPLVLVISLFQALFLSQDFKGKTLYRIIFYTPVITSWVAAAVVWKWLLNGQYGAFNQILSQLGIIGPSWLNDRNWAMPGVVIAAVWKDCGYFALILLAALKAIDKTYYEAADIDGARFWRKLYSITLPLISPTLFLLVVILIIGSLQVFDSVFIMTGGGPAGATTIFMERIYRYAFKMYKMGMASAFSWVMFVLIMLFTLIQFRLQKKWVNYDT
jgi:multiple sugar transport system permease protein